MQKTVKLGTNSMPNPPLSICQPGTKVPVDDISVDVGQLAFHLYLDTHGFVPTRNPAEAYILSLLSSAADFEFSGSGPGSHKEARISESNRYGKAFCRWFLYTHFGMTYFWHMDDVMRGFPAPLNQWRMVRTASGDTPDYCCTGSLSAIHLAEAKGGQYAIDFKSNRFNKWRAQLGRVQLRDPTGVSKAVKKNFIVATQMRNQKHGKKFRTKLFAEDPPMPGDADLSTNDAAQLRLGVIAGHYAGILEKLAMPLEAAMLRFGAIMPPEYRGSRLVSLWDSPLPFLRGRQFVGGLIPPEGVSLLDPVLVPYPIDHGSLPVSQGSSSGHQDRPRFHDANLLTPIPTFFGLDKAIFDVMIRTITRSFSEISHVPETAESQVLPTVSLLRDGTLMAPGRMMRFLGLVGVD